MQLVKNNFLKKTIYKSAKIVINGVIMMSIGVIMTNIAHGFEANPKGTVFYSNGANLYRYDSNADKEVILFNQRKGLVSNKEISNVNWPNYLKSKNKIILIGYGPTYGSRIFECDLNGNNWIEYENPKNLHTLSVSPDGTKIAFGRFIKSSNDSKNALSNDYRYQLVIKEYDKLNKSNSEQVIAEDFSGINPCVWESNNVILYPAPNWNTMRVDLKSGEKNVILDGLIVGAISKDGEFLLCSDESKIRILGSITKIYLIKKSDHTPILLKKFNSGISSQLILSPDKQYFIFTKTRLFSLNEIKDMWIYDLKTGKEKLLIKESSSHFGGFWIE